MNNLFLRIISFIEDTMSDKNSTSSTEEVKFDEKFEITSLENQYLLIILVTRESSRRIERYIRSMVLHFITIN